MMENERFPIDMRTELLTIPNMEIWSNPELNCLWCGCLTYWKQKKEIKDILQYQQTLHARFQDSFNYE